MRTKSLFLSAAALLLGVAAAADPPNQAFPEIRLSDLGGQTMQLSELRGKATIVNFWATWCGPCRVELPELQKLLNDFGAKGLVVLAVNVDFPPAADEGVLAQQVVAGRPRIDSFLTSANVTLPVFLADVRAQAMIDLERIPLTFVLDGKGLVVRAYAGYSPAFIKDIRQQLGEMLTGRAGHGGK